MKFILTNTVVFDVNMTFTKKMFIAKITKGRGLSNPEI